MCYVIITCRSLGWTLLSIIVTMATVASVISPNWLVGMPKKTSYVEVTNGTRQLRDSEEFRPTYGIFNRCTKLQLNDFAKLRENCANFVFLFGAPDEDFPHAWKACLILFAFSGCLLLFAMLCSVMSLFIRSICGKSIFTVAGFIQSIAGLFSVIAMIVYPAGWGTKRVHDLCGEYSDPFVLDRCQLGWSFYLGVVATVFVFLCSILSIQADHSTTSRKVEEEMLEGKNLICVL